jgi:adenosylcobinamide kinase/adenosylcobinamide-phosphate guanylyltransferase
MPINTLVIGGCRSGKSDIALAMADRITDGKKVFIATSVPRDAEMKKRVVKHQNERGAEWKTREVPIDIPDVIDTDSSSAGVILVDCLTLWTSNLLEQQYSDVQMVQVLDRLVLSLRVSPCPVILVSNEVGAGIVPENALSRQFRDLAGWVNQKVAACVDQVILSVAGIPVNIKSPADG